MTSTVTIPLLLEALGSIYTELARMNYAVRDLAAWPSPDSPDLARIRKAMRRGFAHVRQMQHLVVLLDDDDTSWEGRAASLRARGIVVLLQLAGLRGHDLGELLGSSFVSLEALTTFMIAEVGRANTYWVGRPANLDALARAERAFADIGRVPAMEALLVRGESSRDPHIRLTCATLGALLSAAEVARGSEPLAAASCEVS